MSFAKTTGFTKQAVEIDKPRLFSIAGLHHIAEICIVITKIEKLIINFYSKCSYSVYDIMAELASS